MAFALEINMAFCFRLRTRMASSLELAGNQTVLAAGPLPPVTVTAPDAADPIGRWTIFKSCEFPSDAEAKTAGQRLSEVLLIVGAVNRLGIDIGGAAAPAEKFSRAARDEFEKVSGQRLISEYHGLTTYEDGTAAIVGITASGKVVVSLRDFEGLLAPWLKSPPALTVRQRNSATLLNDSFFLPSSEGQFILRISAVEALCDQTLANPERQAVVDQLQHVLGTIACSGDTRLVVEERLRDLSRKSVTQAYLTKFRSLLGNAEADAFKKLYDLRSKFVHDGSGRGQLGGPAAEALELAVA
ncbi:MAG TPA: hypothetical protein VMU01_03680, partial [Rhizomicrobium sp.]|nr:hypothetical protein [Rhizomicrobium sp.]